MTVPRLAAALCLAAVPAGAEAWREVTGRLGPQDVRTFTMDAAAGDVDGDGDADLVLAVEFGPNLLLRNAGGRFAPDRGALPRVARDSEDAALADFDGDGDLDLLVVSEDDRTDEYYLNDGGRFAPAPFPLPAAGISNGLAVADVDGDGDLDAAIANDGPDALWLNDGTGRFAADPLFPAGDDVGQDAAFADIDGDGDPDLIFGNAGPERILVNAGGRFADETAARLPGQGQGGETRDVEIGDVDGDGDPDLILANVRLFTDLPPRNRLWLNDGTGRFRDATEGRLPPDDGASMDALLHDLDGDGDPDLVTAEFGDLTGRSWDTPLRAYRNDGTGRFAPADGLLPPGATGNGMHLAGVDADGDGRAELFLASRGGPDRLLAR